jgi:DNA mismatch repair protein MutS2
VDIDLRTRRSLEWERLKSFLAAESSSSWSRELCSELETHDEKALIEALLKETSEALAMLSAGFGLSQDGLPELRDVLSRLGTGAQLSGAELLNIRRMLVLARRARAHLSQLSTEDFERLTLFPPALHAQEDLVSDIDEVFDDAGGVKDSASPLLQQLRRDVHRLNNQTRDEMMRIINHGTLSKALQEPIYTQRNGRYVLPVQASMRQNIQGILHDSSASGLTVYVEPISVVELTNKIRMKEHEIEREIDRLLSKLSANARSRIDELSDSYRALVEIDFIAARARLAQKYRGTHPTISEDGKTRLKSARHPLLVLQNLHKASSVVANDIVLGGDVRTLVITGPNTGGKTVFLKTAGLLALMLRAGMLLPVENGSTSAIFTKVFADVGDEQSIEQSLSTFSSHMTNIVEILNQSDSGTLALLDEVGAGTDPREGAILARVVMEHLNNSGACTISTTHYGELKTLAYTESGFINGSFEFDEATLSPTYRLRIGVPGSSKAITIASRLGLSNELVAKAREQLNSQQSDIQDMIEQLEARLAETEERKRLLEQSQGEVDRLQSELEKMRSDLKTEKEKLRAGLATRMETELDEANDLIRSLIADLQKAPSISKAQQAQKDLQVLRQELGWMDPQQYEELQKQKLIFQVGQTVKVKSLNQRAVIEALPDEGKSGQDALATVRSGIMKIKVPLTDLQQIQPEGQPAKGSHAAHTSKDARIKFKSSAQASAGRAHTSRVSTSGEADIDVFVRTSRNTLDLRGQRVDEALSNLEHFIDSAYLERLSPLMIIHGHGTGRVKAAVRDFLTNSSYDAKWRGGENYEGGDGVTVVSFR